MIKREKYLARIRPYYNSDEIKILTGIRRCGKSTLLAQIKSELENPQINVISYDFEDYDDSILCSSPKEFYDDVKSKINTGKRNFVFIDEVHYLEDYERVIASIRSSLNCSVFITDSTSHLLSGKLGARFTGRSVEFQILPFTFSEFAQITGRKDRSGLDYYLVHGGMPALYENKKDDTNYLIRLYNAILERDIIQAHSVRNEGQFKKIASFILLNSAETISIDSISDYLKKDGLTCSVPTIMQYIDYLEESYIVSKCQRYSLKGKQVLQTLCKEYAVDTGFISLQDRTGNINLGHLLETVVYNELISRGYIVNIGKNYNSEIDFIAEKNKEKMYFQVAYSLEKDDVMDREFGAFSKVKDNYPKYVISMDSIDYSGNGIKHINALDFLLDSIGMIK